MRDMSRVSVSVPTLLVSINFTTLTVCECVCLYTACIHQLHNLYSVPNCIVTILHTHTRMHAHTRTQMHGGIIEARR